MIIGIFGTLGAGKTILMVLLAQLAEKQGKTIYSNFGIPGSENIKRISDIRKLENCLVLIDDIIPWLDSRQSQSNVFITHLLMASRKKGLDIIYTSQVQSAEDLRLREITDSCFYPYEIEFPVFGLDIWIGFKGEEESEFMGGFDITYSQEVYDQYDTLEIAYQRITWIELIELFNQTQIKKALFVLLLNLRYNIMKTNSAIVYDILNIELPQNKKTEYLEEIFAREGYILELANNARK